MHRGKRTDSWSQESMLNAMLGRPLDATFPARRRPGPGAPVVLAARGVSAPGVDNVSLDIRAGEIVGLAGLVGAGRTELARVLYRANRVTGGSVSIATGPSTATALRAGTGGPRGALRAGLAMIPESRKEQGLLPGRPIAENVTLASLGLLSRAGLVRRRAERRTVTRMLARLAVRSASPKLPVATLSGGNQQKILFGRMLLRQPRVLIADEPTRGVDVGAKRAIYDLLAEQAADGLGVLLISSDVEEILGLAHRVLVMRGGRIAADLRGDDMTEAAILGAAFGAAERGA